MTDDQSLAVPWWRALSIAERQAMGAPATVDVEKGKQRFRRWRQLTALKDGDALDDALSPLGVTCDELIALLGESDDALRARAGSTPTWVTSLERWWAEGVREHHLPDLQTLNVVRPVVAGARAELRSLLNDRHAAFVEQGMETDAAGAFLEGLWDAPPVDALARVVSPTLVLELYLAREGGLLEGDTSAERYQSFVERVSRPDDAADVLARYPALTRVVHDRLRFWIDAQLEMVDRLLHDFDEIKSLFWAGEVPSTVTVSSDQGDSHRRGRAVMIVDTDRGGVVYKPRDARMDLAFDGLLADVNARGLRHELPRMGVLARDGYGWFQKIEERQPDGDERPACAWRLGALTALLHTLRATDMHHENVMLSGDAPYAIDLESLLHTERRWANQKRGAEPGVAVNVVYERLKASCVNIGILPSKIVTSGPEGHIATDISVMGYTPGQRAPVNMPRLVNDQTDEMRVVVERGYLDQAGADGETEPTAEPVESPFLAHAPEFLEGLETAYRAVLDLAEEFGPDGELHRAFADTVTRYIPRATMVYGKVLVESYHPDFVTDGLDRQLCLGKLLNGYHGRSDRQSLVAAETAAMWQGDIPYFVVDSRTGAILPDGDEQVTHLPEPPVAHVSEHVLGTMGEQDLRFQRRTAELAFRTIGAQTPPDTAFRTESSDLAARKVEHSRHLLGWLDRHAVVDGAGLGWLTLAAVTDRDWVIQPTGMDMYSGLGGITLALPAVQQVTGDPAATELLDRLFGQVAEFLPGLEDPERLISSPGAQLETGGYGYYAGLSMAFAVAARTGRGGEWGEACRRTVQVLELLAQTDRNVDVISGNAGAILVVSSLTDVIGAGQVESTVAALAEPLVKTALRDEHGAAWAQEDGGRPLIGYSHGTTGIARALARASRLLGDEEMLDLALDAFAYERQFLTPDRRDWPDLRREAGPGHMRAWCHGSPGAAFGRALTLPDLGDRATAELVAEIDSGAQAIMETFHRREDGGFGIGNHSLCHGDVGNLLCLETMARSGLVDLPEGWLDEAWTSVLDDAEARGWTSGAANGAALPNLMMGMSGIAWGLAYSVQPQGVMNLLALEVTHPEADVTGTARP